uniref:Late embryogenesis abundant protein LEA-2 subgroup domain-containing protein n=1 Tax=Arundo donax TaxID=35708 RepID=A0A0A9HGK7_ARUDO
MAAHGSHERRVSLVVPSKEGGQVVAHRGEEQPAAGRPRPYYVGPSQRWRERPGGPAIEPPPRGAVPMEGSLAMPGGAAPPRRKRFGRKDTSTTTPWASGLPDAHPHQQTPGEAAPPGGSVPSAKPIEGVSMLETEGRMEDARAPGGSPPPLPAHDARPERVPPSGKKWQQAKHSSPMLLPGRKKKRRPVAICFTACCILFWLLVVCIGIAILVVYILYRPQPPRLRVNTATLNSAYIDELPPPRGGLALNSDLYVLTAIYNPNTKIDVVLRYMQLDLYFQGSLIGTQAVWPPMHERPGDSALRSVHLVVSEVRMTQEDVALWQNATVNGSLVQMHLAGMFYTQLNFGRWLPFRYWVYPSCTLWLDPPPAGALRRARCRQ